MTTSTLTKPHFVSSGTTLTWIGQNKQDANPNDPDNWSPHQVPTIHDIAVFPWGSAQMSPNIHWAIGNVVVEGGTSLTLSSIPYISGSLTIQGGGRIFVTATTGTLSAHQINISNGSSLTSARPIDVTTLTMAGGASLEAQNGFRASVSVDVDNGSHGDVWGPLVINGTVGNDKAHVALGSSFNSHGCAATCYAPDTLIALFDGEFKAVQDLQAGDRLDSGDLINWVGKGNHPTQWVRLERQDGSFLIVTEEHLICVGSQMGGQALYPARNLIGVLGLGFTAKRADDYAGREYWHFQTYQHARVDANGFWSESFFDTDGRNDLETVSGERLNRRFDRSEAFAPIVSLTAPYQRIA